jgi:DAK2 domain fusion protein YloV
VSAATTGQAQVVDARTAQRWLDAALQALAEAREEVDALNVFPIPDGDTGTNMFLTMEAAVDALAVLPEGTAYPDALRAAARGAFLGARGNSGVIFSQMFRGLSEMLAESPPPGGGPRELAQAFTRAADLGYEAVGTPLEGTILSVMRAAAVAAEEAADRPGATLGDVAQAAARAADIAVQRTTMQLPALARAGVVDAGGRGLAVVLHAIDTAITGRRQPAPRNDSRFRLAIPEVVDELSEGGPAYEVMYLLDADDAGIPELRARLDGLGDSLLVVGGGGLWNVHVHVDDVGAAIERAVEIGRPYRIRVTHFAEQQQRRRKQRQGTAVVAVAAGEGLAATFAEGGAHVVRSRTGARPSTREMLEAIIATGAAEVIVLPNDRDVLPVARAAAAEAENEGVRVAVIPSTAQVQGVAALAVHEPGRPFDSDVVTMTAAAGHVRHGAVTVAARQAVTTAGICEPGDVLGIVAGDFVVIGDDLDRVADEVLSRLLAPGGELVTVVVGEDGDDDWSDRLVERVHGAHPELDVVALRGGQQRYPLLLGVE